MKTFKEPIDFKNLYSDLEPNPWIVTSLRAKMLHRPDPVFEVMDIFKRYVLAGSLAVLLTTGYLNYRMVAPGPVPDISEFILGTDATELLATGLPDFNRILETDTRHE